MNSKKIISKFLKPKTKTYVAAVIFGIIVAVCVGVILYGCFDSGVREKEMQALYIFPACLFGLPFLYLFILRISTIIPQNRNASKALAQLEQNGDLDAAALELETKVKRYLGEDGELRITDNFLFSGSTGRVFRISDLIQAFSITKRYKKTDYVWVDMTHVYVSTYDKMGINVLSVELSANDQQVRKLFEELVATNPNIVIGNTPQDQQEIKQRILNKLSGK